MALSDQHKSDSKSHKLRKNKCKLVVSAVPAGGLPPLGATGSADWHWEIIYVATRTGADSIQRYRIGKPIHCGDKTILRPFYLHNGISYTGKTSLYWIRALTHSAILYINSRTRTARPRRSFRWYKRFTHNEHWPAYFVAFIRNSVRDIKMVAVMCLDHVTDAPCPQTPQVRTGSGTIFNTKSRHDEVIKWKHFPRCWPFLRGIHRWPMNSPHKGQCRGALMFPLICA